MYRYYQCHRRQSLGLEITTYKVLNILNSFIPATGAVIIADYFIINKGKYTDFKTTKFKSVNISAIIAWVAGVIGAYTIPGITPVNSVLTTVVTYVVLTKLTVKKEVKVEVAA